MKSIPEKYETGSNDYQQGFIDCVSFLITRLSTEAVEEMMQTVKQEVFVSTKRLAEEAAVTRYIAEQNRKGAS